MADSPHSGGVLVKGAAWLETNGPTVMKEVGPYLFGVAGLIGGVQFPKLYESSETLSFWSAAKLWGTSFSLWSVIVACGIAIFAISLQIKQARRDRDDRVRLTEERDKALGAQLLSRERLDEAEQHIGYLTNELGDALKQLSESYLRRIMRDAGLDHDFVRISLYGHDPETHSFVLAGRYSIHPDHKKANRQKLPDDQGFLCQAWTNGGQCFVELDDFNDEVEYRTQVLGKCNMDENLVDALRMKSRVYCARAVSDLYGRTGIVMIESTQKGSLEAGNLLACLEDKNEVLNDLVRRNTMASPFMTCQPRRQQ